MINSSILKNRNNIHVFSHKAMATIFEIVINSDDKSYAEQAAWEAIKELDLLESELSRFIPNSDISKINSLHKGDKIRIGENVFECLLEASKLFEITNGAFNISIGGIIDDYKLGNNSLDDKSLGSKSELILDQNEFSVTLNSESINLDLGGIGKGYAIDKMVEILEDWEITDVFMHGGGSSVKSIGNLEKNNGWPISLSNPQTSYILAEMALYSNSFSSSGLQKGEHIIDPRTGKPVSSKLAAWVITEKAAMSDALTTAVMIMNEDEINELSKNKEVKYLAILTEQDFLEIKKKI
ncbi:MAG: FAD:protein FMN transferase [Melioribacteraceae bacterium]|nr:FAD:protein FMN transferase [Melioribacteraceae bacterium]